MSTWVRRFIQNEIFRILGFIDTLRAVIYYTPACFTDLQSFHKEKTKINGTYQIIIRKTRGAAQSRSGVFLFAFEGGFHLSNKQNRYTVAIVLSILIVLTAELLGSHKMIFPLIASAIAAISSLCALVEKTGESIPPAGTIALLSLILRPQELWVYPIEVILGADAFITVAVPAFPASRPAEQNAGIPVDTDAFFSAEALPEWG